jgi:hypothetical protein
LYNLIRLKKQENLNSKTTSISKTMPFKGSQAVYGHESIIVQSGPSGDLACHRTFFRTSSEIRMNEVVPVAFIRNYHRANRWHLAFHAIVERMGFIQAQPEIEPQIKTQIDYQPAGASYGVI